VDIIMPELSGKELFERITLINEEAVVIFITGFAQEAEYEELMKKGVMIIEKPFTYEILSEKIAQIYL
nr:response regulator [Sedimentibacter sp.]